MPKRVIYHQIPYFKRFGCPSTVHKTIYSTKILPNCTQETQFELNDDPTTLIHYEETLTNCVNEMLLEQVWPVELTYQESGSILASFRDVPEAITEGKGVKDALEQAQDCLLAALGGYVSARRVIPKPLPSIPAHPTIALPPHIEAKIALYNLMLARDVSNAELAVQLNVPEDYIRSLIDLDQNSHIGQIDTVLQVLR